MDIEHEGKKFRIYGESSDGCFIAWTEWTAMIDLDASSLKYSITSLMPKREQLEIAKTVINLLSKSSRPVCFVDNNLNAINDIIMNK